MTIRHIMADGSSRDSINCYLLDKDTAEEFYKAMAKINTERQGKKNEKIQNC